MNRRRQLNRINSVILAGGSGTRFWPLSRESFPKQFLKLGGTETMLQRTVNLADRINQNGGETTIVGHQQLSDAIKLQLRGRKKTSRYQLLLEPVARNTAAAVGLAAVRIGMDAPNAILVVMPSDHLIKKPGVFLKAVKEAAILASQGYLVTFGIMPDRPETGFGYIQAGKRLRDVTLNQKNTALAVHRFVEKPSRVVAKRYLRQGNYFWNSGIFVFRVDVILEAVRKHMPRLYQGLMAIEKDLGTGKEPGTIMKIYQRLPAVSFDCGVMERVERKRIAVLPVDIGWNDVAALLIRGCAFNIN